ncbi:hypothetical protein [Glutamicibacter soli]|uniref:hypothetical protein n=1 Tax=Glutamicibacter soli TaxID=453836 RepID=UPI003FD2B6EB
MSNPEEPIFSFDDNGELTGILDPETAQWAARRLAAQLVACAGRDPESIRNIILKNINDATDVNKIVNMFIALHRLTDVIGDLLGGMYSESTTEVRQAHVNWLLGTGDQDQPPGKRSS